MGARRKTIGRIKKPGTFKTVKIVSGVIGRGGGGFVGGKQIFGTPKVSIRGSEVFIDGLGFSVRPQDQAKFIRQQTGGRGRSSQQAILLAEQRARGIQQAQEQQARQLEIKRKADEELRKRLEKKVRLTEVRTQFGARRGITREQRFRLERVKIRLGKTQSRIKDIRKISGIPQRRDFKLKEKLIKTFDAISGGTATEFRIDKRQDKLNKDVKEFNERFGEKELSESESKTANNISSSIEDRQKQINLDREELSKSIRSKLGRFIGTVDPTGRLTPKEKKELVKGIPKLESKLDKINSEIKSLENKDTPFSRIRIFKLKKNVSGIEKDIKRRKEGRGIKIVAGDLPLIPGTGIPSGVTKVKFIGSQKLSKSGKIITDIIFKTSTGEVGIARGVAVSKKGYTLSLVAGRSGKIGVKFPLGKKRVGRIRSFIGIEKIKSKPTAISLRRTASLIKGKKKVGTIEIVRGNLQALKQAGIGRVFSVKGKKFIKTGIRFPSAKMIRKPVKRIAFDDFASLSTIFTRKQLSLIIGKTITRSGAKSEFIGLIKGTTKAGKTFKLNPSQQKQFSQALNKVISVASSSVSKSQKIKGITKSRALALASQDISKKLGGFPKVPSVKAQTTKLKPIPSIAEVQKPIVQNIKKQEVLVTQIKKTASRRKELTKQIDKSKLKQRQAQTQKQKQEQKLKQEQLQKQKQTQRQIQTQFQRQLQKQKQRLKQTLIRKQAQISKLKITIPRVPKLPRIPLIPLISKRKRRKVTPGKPIIKQGYEVLGKRLVGKKIKGKKRKVKWIKLNRKLLSKRDALDRGSFAIDHSTARTFKIKKVGKVKTLGGITKREGKNFKKTRRKFRSFKIKKGVKKPLTRKFIEKRKFLIDTKGEKRGLKLSRIAKQLRGPPARRKQPRRNTRRRIVVKRGLRRSHARTSQPTKRGLSQIQLSNLAKGRAKLQRMRRNK